MLAVPFRAGQVILQYPRPEFTSSSTEFFGIYAFRIPLFSMICPGCIPELQRNCARRETWSGRANVLRRPCVHNFGASQPLGAEPDRMIIGHVGPFPNCYVDGQFYCNSGNFGPARIDVQRVRHICMRTFIWVAAVDEVGFVNRAGVRALNTR